MSNRFNTLKEPLVVLWKIFWKLFAIDYAYSRRLYGKMQLLIQFKRRSNAAAIHDWLQTMI